MISADKTRESVPSTGSPVIANRGRPHDGDPAPRPRESITSVRWPIAAWAVLIGLSIAVGFGLRAASLIRIDHLPPLHAHFRSPSVWLVPVAAFGIGLWRLLPRLSGARRLPWPVLLGVGWLLAALWAAALAASDGAGALTAPVLHGTEYLAGLPADGTDPVRWLRGFAAALPGYPTHVQGHPPLPVLLLWGLRSAGLGGPGWAATVIIAVGASSAAAVAITVRRLHGENAARRTLPYLVLAPYAVWIATSMDALFLGVGAWAVALIAHARPARGAGHTSPPRTNVVSGVWTMVAAFTGGVLAGVLPYLSYGLVPLLAVPAIVLLLLRPRRMAVMMSVAGLAVVPAAFTLAGFWWFDGVMATQAQWAAGAGAQRPYLYFLVANLAVLALLTGPAMVRALPPSGTGAGPGDRFFAGHDRMSASRPVAAVLRSRRLTTVLGVVRRQPLFTAALAGVVALDLAGVTRGEVERIWLPYAPWLLTAVAVRGTGGRGTMLLAQVVTTLALQGMVRSPW